jgi:hypothetical protein
MFLSYRRKLSLDAARYLHDRLETEGVDVFLDVNDIDIGRWESTLERELIARDYLLVVIADGTLDSQWVQREIVTALRHNLEIIPLLTGDARLDADALPDDLKKLLDFQIVRYNPIDPDTAIRRIMQGVRRAASPVLTQFVASPPPSPSLPPPPSAPQSTNATQQPGTHIPIWVAAIGAIATVLVALIGIVPNLLPKEPTPAPTVTLAVATATSLPPTDTPIPASSPPPPTATPLFTVRTLALLVGDTCPSDIRLAADAASADLARSGVQKRISDVGQSGSDVAIDCRDTGIVIRLVDLPTQNDFYSVLWLTGISSWGVFAEANPIRLQGDANYSAADIQLLLRAIAAYYNRGSIREVRSWITDLAQRLSGTADLCLFYGNAERRYAYRGPQVAAIGGYVQPFDESRANFFENAMRHYECDGQADDGRLVNNLNLLRWDYAMNYQRDYPESLEWSGYVFGRVNRVNTEFFATGQDDADECPASPQHTLIYLCRVKHRFTYLSAFDEPFTPIRQDLQEAREELQQEDRAVFPLALFYQGLFEWCEMRTLATAQRTLASAQDSLDTHWSADPVFTLKIERAQLLIGQQQALEQVATRVPGTPPCSPP